MQALFCNVCTPGRVKPTNPCPLTYAGFQSLKRFQSFSTPLAISHGLHKPGRGATDVIYSWQRCHQFLSSSRWWCGKEFTSDGPRWLVRNQSAPEVAATEHYYKVTLGTHIHFKHWRISGWVTTHPAKVFFKNSSLKQEDYKMEPNSNGGPRHEASSLATTPSSLRTPWDAKHSR